MFYKLNKLTPELLEVLIPIIQNLYTGEIKTDMRTFLKMDNLSISLVGMEIKNEENIDPLLDQYIIAKAIKCSYETITNKSVSILVRNGFDLEKTKKNIETMYFNGLHEIIDTMKSSLNKEISLFNIKEFQMN